MVYSNSYMFLCIGLFVILSSQALANHFPTEPLIHDWVQDDKKSIDYVKDPKNEVVYKMPPEPPTYPEINGEELDGLKVNQEHVMAHKKDEALNLDEQKVQEYMNEQKLEEALNEQELEYLIAQNLEKIFGEPKSQTPKIEEASNEQIVPEYINAQKLGEALDDEKSQEDVKGEEYSMTRFEKIFGELKSLAPKFKDASDKQIVPENIKAQKLAACESPPNPLTDHKINGEALDDQKSQEYVKAQKFAACESPPNPLTDLKINEEALDDQTSHEHVKDRKFEALDNQKDLENSNADQKITASESSKPLAGLEINESKVDWRSFHAKYPWIKMNGHHKSIPGSRKLLNDIANDQLGGLSLQI